MPSWLGRREGDRWSQRSYRSPLISGDLKWSWVIPCDPKWGKLGWSDLPSWQVEESSWHCLGTSLCHLGRESQQVRRRTCLTWSSDTGSSGPYHSQASSILRFRREIIYQGLWSFRINSNKEQATSSLVCGLSSVWDKIPSNGFLLLKNLCIVVCSWGSCLFSHSTQ